MKKPINTSISFSPKELIKNFQTRALSDNKRIQMFFYNKREKFIQHNKNIYRLTIQNKFWHCLEFL